MRRMERWCVCYDVIVGFVSLIFDFGFGVIFDLCNVVSRYCFVHNMKRSETTT